MTAHLYRTVLRRIVLEHGRAVVSDPARMRGLLNDALGKEPGRHEPHVHLLMMALKQRVPQDLLSDAPAILPLTTLAARLERELSVNPDSARWAAEAWSYALGLNHADDGPTERASPAGPPTVRLHAASTDGPPRRRGRKWALALGAAALLALGAGGGAAATFLTFRPPAPAPAAAAPPPAPALQLPDQVAVPPGGAARFRVRLVRAGVVGPVKVACPEPGPGVSLGPIVIPADDDEAEGVVAATGGLDGPHVLRLSASGTGLKVEADLRLAPGPCGLRLEAPRVLALKPGGRVAFPVRVVREGVVGPVRVVGRNWPEGVIVPETTLAANADDAVVEASASADAPAADADVSLAAAAGGAHAEAGVHVAVRPWPFGADTTAYLPDDAAFVLGVNVRRVLGSPLPAGAGGTAFRDLLGGAAGPGAALAALGVDPLHDVDGIVVACAASDPDPARTPRARLIVLGRFDREEVRRKLEAALGFQAGDESDGKGGSYKIFSREDGPGGRPVYAYAGQSALVWTWARRDAVDAAAKASGLRRTSLRDPQVKSFLENASPTEVAWLVLDGAGVRAGGKTWEEAFGLRTATGQAEAAGAGDAVEIRLLAAARDADAARAVAKELEATPDEVAARLGLAALPEGARVGWTVTPDGDAVVLKGRVTGEALRGWLRAAGGK